jgi:plastocyanin
MKINYTLLLCAFVLLAGCAYQSAQPQQAAPQTNVPATPVTPATSATQGTSQSGSLTVQPPNTDSAQLSQTDISIANFAFDPAQATVKAGTTVTWTNNDSAPHKLISDSTLDGFGSKDISQGGKYSYTFMSAGTFDYSCQIHPSMKGSIVVTP